MCLGIQWSLLLSSHCTANHQFESFLYPESKPTSKVSMQHNETKLVLFYQSAEQNLMSKKLFPIDLNFIFSIHTLVLFHSAIRLAMQLFLP